MNLQHIPTSQVQPSHNDDLVACGQPVEGLHRERTYFKPSLGRAFRSLHGRFAAFLDVGPDYTNRAKLGTPANLYACPPLHYVCFLCRLM